MSAILLVEDNAGDVRLTREALREADVDVDLVDVPDGAQAMELLRASPFALVLLDLNLPKMDGLEVLAAMRADPALRATPVVVLTTSSSAGDVVACYERGANCYVVKPLDLDDFTALIRAITRFWLEVAELPRG